MSKNRIQSFTKRFIVSAMASAMVALVLGCGGSNAVTPGAVSHTQVRIGDAPVDKILAFEITINSIALKDTNGKTVTMLSSPTQVELTHLAGTFEPMVLDDVPQGTYTQATVTVSAPDMTYIDPATGQIVEQHPVLASSTAVINLNGVSIGSGESSVNFDFNLANSLTFDASNNATVTPVFTVSSVIVPPSNEDTDSGQIEDVEGVVASVNVNGSSITITPEESAQNLTFTTNSNTAFDGASTLGNILNGEVVQIDALTQPDGSLLATKIEIEDAQTNGLEAEGLVTSVTGNPATSFTTLVEDEASAAVSKPVLGTQLAVMVSSSTAYKFNSDHIDMSNLPFNPTFNGSTIAKAQRVEADADSSSNTTVIAQKVRLQQQALSGTVSNYTVVAGSQQASFTLTVASDSAFAKLTGSTTLVVYQQPKTVLKNILSVNNGDSVRARGLLFFDGVGYRLVASRLAKP